LASASFGAVAVYSALTGDPMAAPLFVVAAVLGLIALACLTEWGRRAFLPTLAVLWFAAFARKQLLDGTPWLIALVLAVPALLITLTVVVYVLHRRKNRLEYHALRLLQTGNAAGAVTLLDEELRANGLTEGGWNALSLAYCALEKWPEALKAAAEAVARGGERPIYLNNKGVILWKSGQAEAALPLLEEAARCQPNDFPSACNLGFVRAELGQRKAAVEMLRRAERLVTTRIPFGADRRVEEREIENLRQKIAELPGDDRFKNEGQGDRDAASVT
jgi:tetratricopeptide (TPR) repeat protein